MDPYAFKIVIYTYFMYLPMKNPTINKGKNEQHFGSSDSDESLILLERDTVDKFFS